MQATALGRPAACAFDSSLEFRWPDVLNHHVTRVPSVGR
jgi:hypothetical protein